MDARRRKFLAAVTAAVPVLATVPFVRDLLPAVDTAAAANLWDRLLHIKNMPAPYFWRELAALNVQVVELTGYINEYPHPHDPSYKFMLSRDPVSCCCDCLFYGASPVVFLSNVDSFSSKQKQVKVAGRWKLPENDVSEPSFCLV